MRTAAEAETLREFDAAYVRMRAPVMMLCGPRSWVRTSLVAFGIIRPQSISTS